MRDITLMPNDYIVTHIKTDTICEHFSNDDVVYAVDERIVPLVRCKECKYVEVADPTDDQDGYICQFHRGSIWFSGSYCSWGERKESE